MFRFIPQPFVIWWSIFARKANKEQPTQIPNKPPAPLGPVGNRSRRSSTEPITRSARRQSTVAMSFPVGEESYPGRGLSVSQLVHETKVKLLDSAFRGRCVQIPGHYSSIQHEVLKPQYNRITMTMRQNEVQRTKLNILCKRIMLTCFSDCRSMFSNGMFQKFSASSGP